MRAATVMWAALAVGVGVALFLVKYKVQALENQLVAKQAQIARDEGQIRVLEAEWTYLNDPSRLRRLSEEYLGFHPATARNVATLNALPMRGENPAAAPQIPQVNAPAVNPERESAPQLRTEMQSPFAVASSERPSILSDAFARLQRLLLPTAAGATMPRRMRTAGE
jgi:hypothetical protein